MCFADRKDELQYFKETARNSARLDPPAPLNYAILGTWGQGKTSLLYKFRQIVLEELKDDIRCVCIYFPLSPQVCQSWDIFCDSFLRTVKSTMNSTRKIWPKIKVEIEHWEVGMDLGVVSAKRKVNSGTTSLVDALQSLWEKILKPSGTQIAFVLLDDLHYFPIKAEESAYLTLRTTFQELVNRKCNYSLVVTAPSLLFSEIAETAEPVLRFFKRFDLKPFTFDETKEAINVRLKVAGSKLIVDDKVIEQISRKTEGHPYLIMFAMFELLTLTRGFSKIGIDIFEKNWPRIEESFGRSIFAQKFQTASDKERELMIKIAESRKDLVSPSDIRGVRGATELFSRLEKKELLIRHGRGRYRLFHPMFAEFLRKIDMSYNNQS
ncbi:hypothetical protein KEJ47_08535 [Candidatus Bathyarchaeota archaeon]|nr:hypothetical protein [Candidatus Bathyarchaeota archaeon]